MIHVRYNGQSLDFDNSQLRMDMTDKEVKEFVARRLDITCRALDSYVVDRRPNGAIIVRPEAVYG